MIIYKQGNLTWDKNKLFFKDEVMGCYIKNRKYKGMFWIKLPDGALYPDFFNLTRVKDSLMAIASKELKNRGIGTI